MTRLYIVRHCEAEGNILRYFQGHTDGQVSEKGKEQCDLLAERFRDIPIEAVYSSPLSRAVFTAEAVNRYHGLPIERRDNLLEINGGHWEKRKWADLPKLYPEEADAWANRPWDFAPKDGEPMRAVYERIWQAVLEIAREQEGHTAAVVAHGGVIRNLLTRVKFGRIEEMNRQGWCDNTAVTILDFDEAFRPTLVAENDTAHLTHGMSTLAGQSWWKGENFSKFE